MHVKRGSVRCIFGVALIISLLSMTSCAPEKIEDAADSEESVIANTELDANLKSSISELPSTIAMDYGENISIVAPIEIPSVDLYRSIDVEKRRFDQACKSIANNIFGLENYSIVRDQIAEGSTNPEDRYYQVEGKNGEVLITCPGVLIYSQRQHYFNQLGLMWQPRSTVGEPYSLKELEGFSQEEALSIANSFLNAVGLIDVSEPTIVAMDCASLNQQKTKYLKDEINLPGSIDSDTANSYEFTVDDEFYTLFYQQKIDDVNVANTSSGYRGYSGDVMPDGCIIAMEIGREGVVYMNASPVYSPMTDQPSDTLQLDTEVITLYSAIVSIGEKYNNVISGDKIEINRITLEYCPKFNSEKSNTIELVPAWIFRYANDPDHSIRVDAISGKIF